MRSRNLRFVLLGWAILLGLLTMTAAAKRGHEHRQLRARIVAYLRPVAETGAESIDAYVWGWSSSGQTFPGSPQGQAIYLLNRGYAEPALLRSLLLCEARRCYDWKYLSEHVNNYDLRVRLNEHCLRNFPDDPKVHWAAGQLALAAGDFELAEAELWRTLELASTADGWAGKFCRDTGISEQHLRGRYACALTLVGKWQEADEQALLARQAGDGTPPPPLDDWDDRHDENWFRQQYPEEHAEHLQVKHRERRLADLQQQALSAYLATHDQQRLDNLRQQLPHAIEELGRANDTEGYWDDPQHAGQLNHYVTGETEALYAALALRAYLLAHQWEAAARILRSQPDPAMTMTYPNQLRPLIGLLLTRLAAGESLAMNADENRAARLAELKAESAESTSDESWWDWDLAYAHRGELSGLMAADYLPFLLRTDGFADALEQSGRPLDQVLAEVRQVVQPQRDNYSDSSNGELHWQ